MRNKILLLIPIMLLVLALIGCNFITPPTPESEPEPVEELIANVVIVDWEQDYIDEEWEDVKVYYKITNIGTIAIDYYQIWFKVICKDGSIYGDWTDGTGIGVGSYEFDDFLIDVSEKEAIRIEVMNWELTHWEF